VIALCSAGQRYGFAVVNAAPVGVTDLGRHAHAYGLRRSTYALEALEQVQLVLAMLVEPVVNLGIQRFDDGADAFGLQPPREIRGGSERLAAVEVADAPRGWRYHPLLGFVKGK